MENLINLGRVSLVPKGEYDPTTQYERLDLIRYGGAVFLALRDVRGVTPTDSDDYMLWVESGTSFRIMGRYDTLESLKAAHPAGNPGDAYAVGSADSNTIYLWSADSMAWQNVGPLQGPQGERGPAGADGKDGAAGPQGPAGPGVPAGGTTGQVLAKKTGTSYDTQWVDAPQGGTDVDLSAYAPKESPVFTGSISMGREAGTVAGDYSFAVGYDVKATSVASFAIGWANASNGLVSFCGGNHNTADGSSSFVIGQNNTATGDAAFIGGADCTAKGMASLAFGQGLIAAAAMQTVFGRYNVSYSGGGSNPDNDGYYEPSAMQIIGKGESTSQRANCFRVTYTGVYASGSYNASGADYAEMFEWADGNPDREDRVGRFVTLDGAKIRLAGPEDDYIIGIVSGNPSVVGDIHDDQWQGMYLYDIFGRPLWEDVELPDQTDQDGRVIIPAHTECRQKLNPAYDNSQTYQPRSRRPEWGTVGMLGKLVVVDDGSCQVNSWCTAGEGGVAVKSMIRTRYRVMERLDERHVRVLIL